MVVKLIKGFAKLNETRIPKQALLLFELFEHVALSDFNSPTQKNGIENKVI